MLHEIRKYDYYEIIYKELVNELEKQKIDYIIDAKVLNSDIDKYVKSRYKKYDIANKIKSSFDTRKIYSKYVNFNNFFEKYKIHNLTYILFAFIILLIIVTGSIFNKTKKYHDLNFILLFSSFIMIMIYGISYIFISIDNDFIYLVIKDSNYYLLGISIIFLEISLFKIIKSRLKK